VATGLLAHDGENYDFKFDRIRRIVGCIDAAEKLQKNYDSAVKAARGRGRRPSSRLRRRIVEVWSLVRRAYLHHDEDIEGRIREVRSELGEVEKAIEKEIIADSLRKVQEMKKAREQEAQRAQEAREALKTPEVHVVVQEPKPASSGAPTLWVEPIKKRKELHAFAKWLKSLGVTNISSPASDRDACSLVDACNHPHGTPDARRVEAAAMRHTRGAVYAMIYELSCKKGMYAVDSIENGLKYTEQTMRNILDLRDREKEEAEIPSTEFTLRSDGATIRVNAKKMEAGVTLH
jgi:hypothetical protein